MISVIISTYRPALLLTVTKNIKATIGVPHEIIAIENKGAMGLCELYNKGTKQAKYDLLCFMHEDVDIKTADWGEIVANVFQQQPGIGLIGVAGSSYKTLTPSHWSFAGAGAETVSQNILQGSKNGSSHLNYFNPTNSDLVYVAAVDGLWFCTTRQIAMEIPFDEVNLTGFHGYDVDYSLSINAKYKVAVTFRILMEHFSEGGFNSSWIEDIIKVHEKWQHILPFNVAGCNREFKEREETVAFKVFVKTMIACNYPLPQILKVFRFQNKNFTFSPGSKLALFLRILKYKYSAAAK